MAAAQPNNRASLLAGLRTGGVRSVSVPHTAAPAGSFNVPRVPSSFISQAPSFFPEEEDIDQLSDMVSQNVYIRESGDFGSSRTAGIDMSGSGLSQQQQGLLTQRQFTPQQHMRPQVDIHSQAQLQLQMMQMEILRLQAVAQMQQMAQVQADSVQVQRQQQWRGNGMPEPASAGPRSQSFAMSGISPLAQLRAKQMEHNQVQGFDELNTSVPMTAALGGRFGSRTQQDAFQNTGYTQIMPPGRLGGVNHGTSANFTGGGVTMAPSKSDSAISWRRSSLIRTTPAAENNGVSSASSTKSIPSFNDSDRASHSMPTSALSKVRPQPLCFSNTRIDAEAVMSSDNSDQGDDSSSSKSDDQGSSSSPTTPLSSTSQVSSTSTREEASKKLFQGLGIGRPAIHVTAPNEAPPIVQQRVVSQPIRQPRGPPGVVDELGDKNFANRIRKKAIGGLGALLEARERRDVDAF